MEVFHWVPFAVAVATVIANAAITHSAVSRHEKMLGEHEEAIQRLRERVAVLRARGGGEVDGKDR